MPVLSLNNTQTNVYQFTMPKANVQVNVSYVKSSLFSIRTQAGTGGKLVANPSSAYWGDTVTVTATPNNGYKTSNVWSDQVAMSGSGNTRTFIMPSKNVVVKSSYKSTEPYPGYTTCNLTLGVHQGELYSVFFGYSNGSSGFTGRKFGSLSPTNGFSNIFVVEDLEMVHDMGEYFIISTRPFKYKLSNGEVLDFSSNSDIDSAMTLFEEWSNKGSVTVYLKN